MTRLRWDYHGKVALVTAATHGIGRAIVARLVESGARVAASARTQADLDGLAADLGDALLPVRADVTNLEDLERLVATTVERFGRIDVAFNVAGGTRMGDILSLTPEDWEEAHRLTLRSMMFGVQYQARAMIGSGTRGAIVNISSINSLTPLRGAIAYATMKAGVDMLTRNAALDLAPHGIRVNALLPGLVHSRGTGPLTAVPALNAAYMDRIPMHRAAEPDEMSGPALFLGSAEASYLTGALLVADGGWTLTGYPDMGRLIGAADGG
ncbi:SDR family oxidoreductase [soil metagenome]